MSAYAAAGTDPADRVVAFLNTLDVEDDVDALGSVDEYVAWSGQDQTRTTLARARRLRDHLRAAAAGEATPAPPLRVEVEVVVDGGAGIVGTDVVAEVAAAAATLAIEGRLGRVKICPADDCRWAFYDRSKNQSRQWCSMKVCGNRAKVRTHRERH
ncbi:CGNR zinc finger domain-containing protein [Mumia zhuanghuii]|uniref:CGNR zinc finger domain-containing protein n=2 Tax=Mumia TaxID=1546255 RepID=A0ABW1QGX7_9ACTN|nr:MULTISPECIES: CGNR zinc finger domain-containing protein [Mumia]KAA1422885.1 CGNR zinc finger domain-containing protein [Mumia zhuanghuii]